jgi:hypothetical protein
MIFIQDLNIMSQQKGEQRGLLKMAVFWVVAPCSLVEVYQRFRGTCCLHHQGNRFLTLIGNFRKNNQVRSLTFQNNL